MGTGESFNRIVRFSVYSLPDDIYMVNGVYTVFKVVFDSIFTENMGQEPRVRLSGRAFWSGFFDYGLCGIRFDYVQEEENRYR